MTTKTKNAWPFKNRCSLTAHRNGQWCKKIKGKVHYFGMIGNPEAALKKYLDEADALHSGLTPDPQPTTGSGLSVEYLVHSFLTRKHDAMQAGEITGRTYHEYLKIGKLIQETFGEATLVANLTPDDFTRLRNRLTAGPTRRANEVVWVRSFFKPAEAFGVLVRMQDFKKPPAKVIRKMKRQRGDRLYKAWEIRRLIRHANPFMRSAILLAINGGFGAMDASNLTRDVVDLEAGMIDTVREKTEVRRIVPLWPETVTALKSYCRSLPASPDLARRFFLTPTGQAIVRETALLNEAGETDKVVRVDSIGHIFPILCKAAGVKCRGFYTLRHNFNTWADDARDKNAIDLVMGHAFEGMDAVYVEGVPVARLRAVCDVVRRRLLRRGPGAPEWVPTKTSAARHAPGLAA